MNYRDIYVYMALPIYIMKYTWEQKSLYGQKTKVNLLISLYTLYGNGIN